MCSTTVNTVTFKEKPAIAMFANCRFKCATPHSYVVSHAGAIGGFRNGLVTGYSESMLNYSAFCEPASIVSNSNGVLTCPWSGVIPGK